MAMKTTLVADDHPIVREGVRDLLQKVFASLIIEHPPGSEGVVKELVAPRGLALCSISICLVTEVLFRQEE